MQEPISATTLSQHIVGHMPPRARGQFTRIMMEIQYCAHMLSTMIESGGLSGTVLGTSGEINIQQEEVQRLDELANRILMTRLKNSELFAALASVTLGLAPFFPEPHILGKLRWIAGGAKGMQLVDWFDALMHGAPWLLLIGTDLYMWADKVRKKNER